MKIKKLLLLIAIFGMLFNSCQNLDLEPQGTLGESELWGNANGLEIFFAYHYNQLPIEDFVHYANNGYRPNNYWEAMKQRLQNASGEFVNTWTTVRNDGHNYWPYDLIRQINDFIINFPKYESNFSPDNYNQFFGEAHFIRAFYYFGMAKRYGGVPIITDVLFPDDPDEKIMVPRTTEYETWKFIHSDLQIAIDNMSDDPRNVFRANKYTAAALMSRTMLYAATNAQYDEWYAAGGEIAYDQRYAGIDKSRANEFFGYVVEAGKIVEQGGYSLYYGHPNDLAENFAQIFLDSSSPENIFVKAFNRYTPGNVRLRHQWSAGMLPNPQLSNFVGSQSYPALDFMRIFDFPDIVDDDGYPVRYENRGDIREGIEPRLRGSVWFNGDEIRDVEFWTKRGNYKTFNWKADVIDNGDLSDEPNESEDIPDPASTTVPPANIAFSNRILSNMRYGIFYIDQYNIPRTLTETQQNNPTYVAGLVAQGYTLYRHQGDHGLRQNEGGENNNLTGAFVRKYVDPTNTLTADYGCSTDWIVFRLAEIYLNMAEALYELGEKEEAFDYIEKIRTRAGAKSVRPTIDDSPFIGEPSARYNAYTYPHSIETSLQFIRDERRRELWGENHWWWDIRRWRTADVILRGYRPRALSCYYVIDEGKYIYLDERIKEGSTWTANRNCYYQGIQQAEMNRNPNLLPQNPFR